MVRDLQTPRVTEIQVRMDCNGCVQKIKKALDGINGINDFHIDFPQQKLTIIGRADPEKIVKAIKKARKNATICSNIEPRKSASPLTEPGPEHQENAPAPDATQQTPPEAPSPLPEQPSPDASHMSQSNPGAKDVGEVDHMIYHHLPNCVDRSGSSCHSNAGHRDRCHNGPVFLQEPHQPVYVTHSYNTYKPSPYVTEYEQVRSPPPSHTHYNRMELNNGDFHNDNIGNITSMFSDDNPNACRIV